MSTKQLTKVGHVIFDMDGLLLDTEGLYTKADNLIAKKFSRQDPSPVVTWNLKVRQMGMQRKAESEMMVEELDLSCTPEQYLEETHRLHLDLFPKVGLLDGVEKLIRHLAEANVPIAVATSSSREYFELKTQTHTELFKLFHHIVTGQNDPEVKNGKPAPDINLVCAKR
jgi:beta-phosphoglucomutase-like phosphatase (HAD superfamily)